MSRRTKIVCTLGPASSDLDTIRQLIRAGMDVARLNFSHGTQDDHLRMINLVREAGEDRKSTRLNSSHVAISYAVFCLKKKKKQHTSKNIAPEVDKTTQENGIPTRKHAHFRTQQQADIARASERAAIPTTSMPGAMALT